MQILIEYAEMETDAIKLDEMSKSETDGVDINKANALIQFIDVDYSRQCPDIDRELQRPRSRSVATIGSSICPFRRPMGY